MLVVMCDASDVVICFEHQVKDNEKAGMRVFGHAATEADAQQLVERCELSA